MKSASFYSRKAAADEWEKKASKARKAKTRSGIVTAADDRRPIPAADLADMREAGVLAAPP